MTNNVCCWQKHKKKHKERSGSADETPVIGELEKEVNSDTVVFVCFKLSSEMRVRRSDKQCFSIAAMEFLSDQSTPFSSARQHLSYDDCLVCQNCSGKLKCAVLTVLCIEFCLTGPIPLCVDFFVFVFVYFVFIFLCIACRIMVGWT